MSGESPVSTSIDGQIVESLARLAPYLALTRVALTGSVAIDLHLGGASRRRRPRGQPRGDLDLIAESAEVVSPGVLTDFLLSHYHLPHDGYSKFLVQLVDPVTGVRVDVFPDSLGLLPKSERRDLDGVSVPVLDPHALLAHKLALLSSASPDHTVEAKHHQDAVLLARRWGEPPPHVPRSVLGRSSHSRDVTATCARCAASRRPEFPLAPKTRIFDILGYV
jgi:hypothetical protein